MPDYEHAMLVYVKLAALSQRKQQLVGRDKFLVLAGAAACRAGWLEVADRCRTLILDHNKAHLVGKSATFPDAMRTEDFQAFEQRLERFCPVEHAEYLLGRLNIATGVPQDQSSRSRGEYALSLLSG